jgi:hypothetical protein
LAPANERKVDFLTVEPRKREVGDLDDVGLGQEEVFRLDVAMNALESIL